MWLYFRLFLLGLRLLRRDRRDLVLENLALRQQLAVFERRGRRPTLGPALLVAPRPGLAPMAAASRPGPAGHRGALASDRVADPLASDESGAPTGPPARRPGGDRLDPAAATREPDLGNATDPGRTPSAGALREPHHDPARRLSTRALAELAHLPPAPRGRDLGLRLLHRADADVPHAPRLLRDHA